jgi:hypothetical protein
MPKSKEREALTDIAQRFSDLVVERNKIFHGKPCTGPLGDARLSSSGVIEIADLEDAADAFVECGGQLNQLYYGFLKNYIPASQE